jgi:C1A family cysteine protease
MLIDSAIVFMAKKENCMSKLYNWIPDKEDSRDHKYLLHLGEKLRVQKIPSTIDLRARCSPVEDQKNMGSCTANALTGNMEFLEKKIAKKPTDLSRLFIYYNERVLEGTVDQDKGAQLRDGIKVLHKQGVCPEKDWPYKEQNIFLRPDQNCYQEALIHRISSYERLNTLEEMKDCLASGFPFVFGFQVFSSFESEEVAHTGVVNLPSKSEEFLGGHAVMAVGFDEGSRRFLIRNSWGPKWGIKGYFTMPYDYLTGGLASDFWTIYRA